MRLREQLALAFFVMAVLPLLGVTLYAYLGSQTAIRQIVRAEANALAVEMSARVDLVQDELAARLARMRNRPTGAPESAFEKARREALAAAQVEQLKVWLRSLLSQAERDAGAIPFALDAQGRLYAPEARDEQVLAGLGVVPGRQASRLLSEDWVIAERPVPESRIQIGVARPIGAALRGLRVTAARNLALGLGLALLASLGILPLSRRMTRHLASLDEGARRLAAGELEVRVPVPHGREFARLAETFNRMARELRVNQQRVVEQERLRKELEIGRRIQEELLPRGPLHAPFAEAGGVSIPAREVGGDFFNYFALPDDDVALLVGDVSGKGVPAALLMASLQAYLRVIVPESNGPDEVLHRLNHLFCHNIRLTKFVSVAVVRLDLASGELSYANAGHHPPFIIRRENNGGVATLPLPPTGAAIGLVEGAAFAVRTDLLRTGDQLILYTDGVVEACNDRKDEFSEGRLLEQLAKTADNHIQSLYSKIGVTTRAGAALFALEQGLVA